MAEGTGQEMLGDLFLGGGMLGGGPSGGSGGGAGGAMVGDWFVGDDMLGGAPSGDGDGGGGGGPGVTGEAGNAAGEATVSGSLDILSVFPVEAEVQADATVSGTLSLPVWSASGVSAGESAFDPAKHVAYQPNLRLGDPATAPFQEQFDARPDFPHLDGDHWFYDHWFAEHGNAATHTWGDSTGAVDVQGGRGRIFARGYNSPSAYARVMARTQELGDIDLTFEHEFNTGFAAEYEFWFHTDGTWSARSASGRPRNGYRVIFYSTVVRLYRVVNGGSTLLGEILRDYTYDDLEKVRIQTVGSRIWLKVWDGLSPEPGSWDVEVEGGGRGYGYLQWLTEVAYGGGSAGSLGNWSRAYLDNISVIRVDQPLLAQSDGEATVAGDLSLPTLFNPEDVVGESTVVGEAEVHLLSGGLIACDSEVQGTISRAVPLEAGAIVGQTTLPDVEIDLFNYGGVFYGESIVTADPDVEYDLTVDAMACESVVDGDLTYWVEVGLDEIGCSSDVEASFDVHMLPGGVCAGESEVEAHLWYLDGLVPLGGEAAGESTPTGSIVGFFSVSVDDIACSTVLAANLTYWKPLGDAYVEGSAEVTGQFEIYTIPPGPIDCASEVTAHLDGEWVYRGEILCEAEVELHMVITTHFLPGPVEGEATVTNKGVWLDPHDLYVDRINGRTAFRSEGRYLVLNLNRGMGGRTTTPDTANADDHPYTGTRFLDAILGMPVIIGLYQADRAQGLSEVIANLFINEGGQANCNSRVEGLINLAVEKFLAGETTGHDALFYDIPMSALPEYFRPEPPPYVLEALRESLDATDVYMAGTEENRYIRIRSGTIPCGAFFPWVDFWRRGDLEPQVSGGETFVGQYFEGDSQGRVNVHPTGHQTWYRPAGYFVETTGFNTLGLFATTSTEDDQYSLPYSYPSTHPEYVEGGDNRTEYGDNVFTERRAGQTWHEQIPDPHPDYFHGYCGTRFVSTIDGSNSVDLFWEPKNALYALIDGVAEVIGDFIIIRYRTITVLGNVARKADLSALIEGNIAKSPDTRMPFTRQPRRKARELEKVRSGNTLYT